MARRTQTYAVRLAVEGGGQVKAELVSVGQSGEQSLKRRRGGTAGTPRGVVGASQLVGLSGRTNAGAGEALTTDGADTRHKPVLGPLPGRRDPLRCIGAPVFAFPQVIA